jgi:hypothetical protein
MTYGISCHFPFETAGRRLHERRKMTMMASAVLIEFSEINTPLGVLGRRSVSSLYTTS